MKVSPIDNKYITPKSTGYASAVGLAVAAVSGISKNITLRKIHKPVAYFSAILTIIHIALIEYNHFAWKHKDK
ncbi:hypothetical protein IKQ21_07270 [bacterium]|nr:hypothetical protein [bacterium]